MKPTTGLLALAALIVACTTVLVALGKLDANLYVGAIVSPLVGGIAASFGVAKVAQATGLGR